MSELKDYSPAGFLIDATRKRSDSLSIIIPEEQQYTVAESLSLIRSSASYLLDLGIKPGDRVAIISANSPFHLWLYTACSWIGAVTVILNHRLSATEISNMLADSGSQIAFFDEKSLAKYQEFTVSKIFSSPLKALPIPDSKILSSYPQISTNPLPCPAGKVATILYTSGSSGKPKGVVLTYENLYWGSQNFRHGFQYHPHWDIEAVAAPISHIGGFNGTTLDIFCNGGTVILFSDFNPDFILKNLEKYAVNVMFMVPTMYWLLIKSKLWNDTDLSAWRLPLIGGDSITDELAQLLFRKGLRPLHVWGMTELSASGSCVRLKPTSPVTTSIGHPFIYNQLEIRDTNLNSINSNSNRDDSDSDKNWGEFFISGPAVTPGYWNNDVQVYSDSFGLWVESRNSFFGTGDVGFFDAEGLLFLVGRADCLITRGGETFSSLEVEKVLKQVPGINDVAVVGVTDLFWGEAVCAVIVPDQELLYKLGGTISDLFGRVLCLNDSSFPKFLFNGLNSLIAGWKLPNRVCFLEYLPETAVGKIDYAFMRGLFS